MRSNDEIKHDVEAELAWTPDIDETHIAVTVNGSIVTLTGFVNNYAEKYQAERAAKRVLGVAGVADDIQVRLPAEAGVDDSGIASAAVAALKANLPICADRITVVVSDGLLSLEGRLEWNYERERAEDAVRHLRGVRMLNNQIRLEPRVEPLEIKRRIEEAFRRSAELDAEAISVTAQGRDVTLKGKVRSWKERLQAQQTAWSAPGVASVQNNIDIASD
ncbi:MAG: BON domain-containing protein [Steroidobacteraceae bacterium]